MVFTRRHRMSFDLRAITDRGHRRVIQDALNVCDFPFIRIRRKHGVRVPVDVTTLRYSGDHAEGVHPLENPDNRAQALGLYWLPTGAFPVGRVEVSVEVMDDPDLAREVFLAEAAHAVDYGVLTDAQRQALFTVVHGGDGSEHGTHGWFEERGGDDYWVDWVGEVLMSLFMRAFAPSLPRPLEARQPWVHRVDDEMARQARVFMLCVT